MDELIAFLTARLDEDEATARAAVGDNPAHSDWRQVDPDRQPGRIESRAGYIVVYDEGSPDVEEAAHIARHDPARVLRDVEAGRKLLACRDRFRGESAIRDDVYIEALRFLAVAWSDHPDYDPEWA